MSEDVITPVDLAEAYHSGAEDALEFLVEDFREWDGDFTIGEVIRFIEGKLGWEGDDIEINIEDVASDGVYDPYDYSADRFRSASDDPF